jgi:hypothetical protein
LHEVLRGVDATQQFSASPGNQKIGQYLTGRFA